MLWVYEQEAQLLQRIADNIWFLCCLSGCLCCLTTLPDSFSILRTNNNFSYPAADLTRTAFGLLRLLVRLSGTRYLANSKIRRVVLTVLNSSSRQSCSVFTNVTSTLEVFLNRYALYKCTFYLLTFT